MSILEEKAKVGRPSIMDNAITQWHRGIEGPAPLVVGLTQYPCGCQGVAAQCANLAHRKDDHEG